MVVVQTDYSVSSMNIELDKSNLRNESVGICLFGPIISALFQTNWSDMLKSGIFPSLVFGDNYLGIQMLFGNYK